MQVAAVRDMHRRTFLKTTALASLTASASSFAAEPAPKQRKAPQPKPPPPPVNAITPPVLQNISETSVTVFWTTGSPATGWVEYGDTPALGRIARGEVDGLLPYDDRVLRVRLTGLRPGAVYYYARRRFESSSPTSRCAGTVSPRTGAASGKPSCAGPGSTSRLAGTPTVTRIMNLLMSSRGRS
jgi:phosphodiesterase/alkaline phosphatase D-like protein